MFVQIHYSKWDSQWLFLLLHNYMDFIPKKVVAEELSKLERRLDSITYDPEAYEKYKNTPLRKIGELFSCSNATR